MAAPATRCSTTSAPRSWRSTARRADASKTILLTLARRLFAMLLNDFGGKANARRDELLEILLRPPHGLHGGQNLDRGPVLFDQDRIARPHPEAFPNLCGQGDPPRLVYLRLKNLFLVT